MDWIILPRSLQHVVIQTPAGDLNIFNYHGIAKPGDKLDTAERLEQSEKILKIWHNTGGHKILCGDFNLMPETQSVKILERSARNLIKEFNIDNTRNALSWNKFGHSKQHFADYVFVSPEIKVKSFEVPYMEVSDHLPMELVFRL